MTSKTSVVPADPVRANSVGSPPADASKSGDSSPNATHWSMNEVTAAHASAALHRAHAMFNRVLAGWASDVLRFERQVRLGQVWPSGGRSRRTAA